MEEKLINEAIKFARERNHNAIIAYNQVIRRILKEEKQEHLYEGIGLSPTTILSAIHFKDRKKCDAIRKKGVSCFVEPVLVDFICYMLEGENKHFSKTDVGNTLKGAIKRGALFRYIRNTIDIDYDSRLDTLVTKLLKLYDVNY